MRVLIVDDSGFSRTVLAGLFSQARPDCTVNQAANAQEALRQIAETTEAFDLITIDIHMPGMDGLELVQVLRQKGVTSSISLISANVQEAARSRAAELGVDFVAKPVNLAKITGLLKGHAA